MIHDISWKQRKQFTIDVTILYLGKDDGIENEGWYVVDEYEFYTEIDDSYQRGPFQTINEVAFYISNEISRLNLKEPITRCDQEEDNEICSDVNV